MYSLILLAFLFIPNAHSLPVQGFKDSSGIYRTKNDFLVGRISNLSDSKIKITSIPIRLRFPFSIDSDETIYLFQQDRTRIRIRPDSTYGFLMKGIQFVYINSEKQYLAVLNDKKPLYCFLKEKMSHLGKYGQLKDTLLYTQDLDVPLKEFTEENIRKDFSNDQVFMNQLLKLHKDIKKNLFHLDVDRADFFKYQKLVQKYLYNPVSFIDKIRIK